MLTKERSKHYQFQLWKTKGVRTCNLITYKILAGLIKVCSTGAKPQKWFPLWSLSAAEICRTAEWSRDYPFNKCCVFAQASMVLWGTLRIAGFWIAQPFSTLTDFWLPNRSVHSMSLPGQTFDKTRKETCKCSLGRIVYIHISNPSLTLFPCAFERTVGPSAERS